MKVLRMHLFICRLSLSARLFHPKPDAVSYASPNFTAL